MTAPSTLPLWDTTQTNVTTPTGPGGGSQLDDGYPHGSTLQSGVWNYQMNLIGQWIAYFQRNVTRNIFPTPLNASTVEWTVVYDAGGDGRELILKYTGGLASDLTSPLIDLQPLQGYRLGTLTVRVLGDATNNLKLNVEQTGNESDGTAIATRTLTAPAAAWTDYVTNVDNAISGLTVVVASSGNTYTRSTGSFITDGFYVGQNVTWSGFVNSGNNQTVTITTLSATVMGFTGSCVNETLIGATVVPTITSLLPVPAIDATFGLMLRLTPNVNGASFAVKLIRATYIPV